MAASATPTNTAARRFDAFTQEERMTVCNMSIEGGARVGYVNPDETTFAYLKGRPYSPIGAEWDAAVERWKSFASDPGAHYDDVITYRAEDIAPVTWSINPGQAIFIDEKVPVPGELPKGPRHGGGSPCPYAPQGGHAHQGHQGGCRFPRQLYERPPQRPYRSRPVSEGAGRLTPAK